jgi:hypothetical protein
MKISLEKATSHWFSKSISSEKTERGLRCGCQKFWLFLVIATISSDVGTVRKQRNGFRLICHQSRALSIHQNQLNCQFLACRHFLLISGEWWLISKSKSEKTLSSWVVVHGYPIRGPHVGTLVIHEPLRTILL